MAYEDWSPEFQDLWENIPIDWSELTDTQLEYTEYMFEEGFMRYSGEIPREDISYAREEFWDMIGQEYEDYFDWEGWREAMYPE